MASPSSGDDYYASLGNGGPAQTGGGSEKKKIIKIVAKKAPAPLEIASLNTEIPAVVAQDTTPISNTVENQEPVHIVESTPEVQPYVSRTVRLPESGTLDL